MARTCVVPRAGVSLCRRAASRQHARQHARSRRLNRVTVDASGGEGDGAASTTPTPEQQEMMKRMAQMREDPKVQEQMNVFAKAMEDEKVQAQIQEAQAQFQSADFQAKVKALQDDPEFKEMFDELKTGGMAALMKFWNDPKVLSKLSQKMGGAGGAPAPQGNAGAAAGGGPPGEVEVNDIFDAAKFGDLEAAEDFIAIGVALNERDSEGRTPLHFACGAGHEDVAQALIDAGADVDAVESKQNSPLMYAAGYGRVSIAWQLLRAGCKAGLRNGTGKTALDLARLSPTNPINEDADLVAELGKGASTFVDVDP